MQVCSDINTELFRDKLPQLTLNNENQVIENTLFMNTASYNLKARNHGGLSWTDHPKTKIEEEKRYHDTKLKRFLRNYKIQYFKKITLMRKYLNYMLLYHMICLMMDYCII